MSGMKFSGRQHLVFPPCAASGPSRRKNRPSLPQTGDLAHRLELLGAEPARLAVEGEAAEREREERFEHGEFSEPASRPHCAGSLPIELQDDVAAAE